MSAFKFALIGILFLFISLISGSKCPQETISKFVICYYEGETSVHNINICNCTHLIFTNAVRKFENNSLEFIEDAKNDLAIIKKNRSDLLTLFTIKTKPSHSSDILKSTNKSQEFINEIENFLEESHFDGVELNFMFDGQDGVLKESYASFIKNLSKIINGSHERVKREGYDVVEKLQDDVTTVAYSTQTPKNSTSKTYSIKPDKVEQKKNRRNARDKEEDSSSEDSKDFLNLGEITTESQKVVSEAETLQSNETLENFDKKYLLFIRLSIKPEIIAKKFDLKVLSRFADVLMVPTHDIVNENEKHLTYHPSRLMGLTDIFNTDSILDFLTGMGAIKSKIVITLPATVLKFELKESTKNTPRSPTISLPQKIDQSQLCLLFNKNNWTLERDDDLTAPYAFSEKTWLAFEDDISINIKGKYILLRELAGGAIFPIDADVNDESCDNRTGSGGHMTNILYQNFRTLERKSRALVLENLQEEIHDVTFSNLEAGVKLSEYRIVRVVDHSGAVHVIRKNTKTQFECSRQGYFSHPLGCNKFYRCVKFDQYSDEFTVFEYNCPAGLAFDERWEVCVWPGSLPHGAPCTGSSEIAPVPRSHYQCPNQEGYFADPENCRWFFACLDHARDGITPLTAYEFRCPFGLVFNEIKLACDWPWLVGACGNRGAAGYIIGSEGAASAGVHTASFINGGNLEASFGKFGNLQQETSFENFGRGFGNTIKEGLYQGAQSAGYGYIASSYDDNNKRASFGSIPEYEISGGRILNKGGFVIDQSKGFDSIGTDHGTTGTSETNLRGSNNQYQYTLKSVEESGKERNFYNTGNVVKPQLIQKILRPVVVPALKKLSAEENLFSLASVSTPGPFSVSLPSVQINEEKIFENSQNLNTGLDTNSNLNNFVKFNERLLSNDNIHLDGSEGRELNKEKPKAFQSFLSTIPTSTNFLTVSNEDSSGNIKINIQENDQTIKQNDKIRSSVTPIISTLKPQIHRFNEINFKKYIPSSDISVDKSLLLTNSHITTGAQSLDNLNDFTKLKTSEPDSAAVPVISLKPEISSLEPGVETYTGSSSVSESAISLVNPVISFTERYKNKNSKVGQPFFHTEISNDTPETISIENINFKQNIDLGNAAVSEPSILGVTPQVLLKSSDSRFQQLKGFGVTDGLGIDVVPATPKTIINNLEKSTIDQKVALEINFKKPENIFENSKLSIRPQSIFHSTSSGSKEISSSIDINQPKNFNTVAVASPETEFYSTSQPKEKQNEFFKTLYDSTPTVSYAVSGINSNSETSVLSSAGFRKNNDFDKFSGKQSATLYNLPVITPTVEVNSNKFENEKVTPILPIFKDGSIKSFGYNGVSTTAIPKEEINIYSQKLPIHEEISSVTPFKATKSEIYSNNQFVEKSQDHVRPELETLVRQGVEINHISKPEFNFTYALDSNKYENHISGIKIISETPKSVAFNNQEILIRPSEKSKLVNQVSIEQQPIVSIGTFSTINYNEGASTPRPFIPRTTVPISVSTPNYHGTEYQLPLSTISPPLPITSPQPISVNSFTNSQQSSDNNVARVDFQPIKSFVTEDVTANIKGAIVDPPKFLNSENRFNDHIQQFGGFSPKEQSTISYPPLYQQKILSGVTPKSPANSNFFLSLPEVKILDSKIHQSINPQIYSKPSENSETVFSNLQKTSPKTIFSHNFEFVTAKPEIATQKIEYTRYQAPFQVSTFAPETKPKILPQFSPSTTITPLVSEKGFLEIKRNEDFVPELFESTKTITHVQPTTAKSINIHQRPTPVLQEEAFKEKQVNHPFYHPLLNKNGYSQLKNLNSEEQQQQVLFQQSFDINSPQTSEYESEQYKFTEKFEHQPARISVNSEQSNIVQLQTTQIPQNLYPSVTQTPTLKDSNFQKINDKLNIGYQPEVYSTTEQSVNFYEFQNSRLPNLTFKNDFYQIDLGKKFSINPKIEIPQPPQEYLLAQNVYQESNQELLNESVNRLKPTGLPSSPEISTVSYTPRYRQSSKTLVVSEDNANNFEQHEDKDQQLFDEYSERFGQVINDDKIFGGVATKENKEFGKEGSSSNLYQLNSGLRSGKRRYHGSLTSAIPATNKYEEYEIEKENLRSFDSSKINLNSLKTTIDLKNLNLDKNKKTVIVVSQVSDTNPVLIGKLAGQCSCQSNMLELRSKNKKSENLRNKSITLPNNGEKIIITNEYLPPKINDERENGAIESLGEGKEIAAEHTVIDNNGPSIEGISYKAEQSVVSSTTTNSPSILSPEVDFVLPITPKPLFTENKSNVSKKKKNQFRGKARYLPSAFDFGGIISGDGSSSSLFSSVSASDIANTLDYAVLKGDESRNQNEVDGDRNYNKALAGAAFDRYGPGGWRGFDETLQGSVDCQRPGLFRHPKYCNKFYACNYDPWKERYTLHVFNCPIRLTYDSSINACNWPVRGPACADDNILV